MTAPLTVAVVGHTNTGKTSLLRTLTRDVTFGEVSPRPAVTRHVEGTAMLVDGTVLVELYDTPGLEDSIGLLDELHALGSDRRSDGLDVIESFLAGPAARGRFGQEAKALRQVLGCDVALYVIDARDRVLAKHRDELEILSYCARPVVPVLNFTASDEARTAAWREQLSRVNMHAVAEFDTVVLDEQGEQRLFEKMRTLLDGHAEALTRLIDDRLRQRAALVQASTELVAELLVDVAAFVAAVPIADPPGAERAIERMREAVRRREQRCVGRLLELHRFRPEDCEADALPISDGQWGLDLFSPEALRQFGVVTGSAAVAGAVAGLAVDAATGGLSLGAGAVIGATIGGVIGAARTHGRRLVERVRGQTELRCDDATLKLLAARQVLLVDALLRRGHASQSPYRLESNRVEPTAPWKKLPGSLARARMTPRWSSLGEQDPRFGLADPGRRTAIEELARVLGEGLVRRE